MIIRKCSADGDLFFAPHRAKSPVRRSQAVCGPIQSNVGAYGARTRDLIPPKQGRSPDCARICARVRPFLLAL